LNARSGLDVMLGALSEALREDPRFVPLTDLPPAADEIDWHPALSPRLPADLRAGRACAIGPNVLYGWSQAPGASPVEREIMSHRRYAAIFTFSRWYSELLRLTMAQPERHVLLDFPLPRAWARAPRQDAVDRPALIYLKGGAEERRIAEQVARRHPGAALVEYGRYERRALLDAACRSAVCYYLCREEHFGIAGVEIALTGCPIISDEKACPTVAHGTTGRLAPVRERDTRARFAWAPDAAERLLDEHDAARRMDRQLVRRAVLARHDPSSAVAKIATALNLEGANDGATP
jgi:hypothetical protein